MGHCPFIDRDSFKKSQKKKEDIDGSVRAAIFFQ